METRGYRGEAVMDTGSTYTLMQNSLWQQLARPREQMVQVEVPPFVLADGKSRTAMGMLKMTYV